MSEVRLIDAVALRKAMYHEAMEKDSDETKWESGCWIRYKMFERVLKTQPTIDPVKWIPVTESLPEKMATVLVTYGDSIEFGRLNDNGWEWLFEAGWDYWAKCHAPKAWMPLPMPWRGEE